MNRSGNLPGKLLRRRRYLRGHFAETIAAIYLTVKGYRIIARRYRSRVGEIDLIAKRFRRLAFIEVKARADFDDGLWAIAPYQQVRIIRAAQHWLQKYPSYQSCDLAFDVIVIVPWRGARHHHQVFEVR